MIVKDEPAVPIRLEFDAFFRKALGVIYQIRLAGGESGAVCRSQLINIPTGLGKTAAVVIAWLSNRAIWHRAEWPRRFVYCLCRQFSTKKS